MALVALAGVAATPAQAVAPQCGDAHALTPFLSGGLHVSNWGQCNFDWVISTGAQMKAPSGSWVWVTTNCGVPGSGVPHPKFFDDGSYADHTEHHVSHTFTSILTGELNPGCDNTPYCAHDWRGVAIFQEQNGAAPDFYLRVNSPVLQNTC